MYTFLINKFLHAYPIFLIFFRILVYFESRLPCEDYTAIKLVFYSTPGFIVYFNNNKDFDFDYRKLSSF